MRVTIDDGRMMRQVECKPDTLLSQAIRSAGVIFPMPCGGNHTCGKCRVKVTGALLPPDADEIQLLGAAQTDVRLACFARLAGDCCVSLFDARVETARAGLWPNAVWDSFEPGSLGLAADIGTTTVAVYLCDLHERRVLVSQGAPNAQCALGADVISRIDYSNRNGVELPRRQITEQLDRLFAGCLASAPAQATLKRLTVTGNTTMLHFLAGKDPRGIAQAPFTPESTFGMEVDAGEMFAQFAGLPLYLPACVHAYVGADILCAAAAVELAGRENALLLDVGTNGEMALFSGGRLLCCAAAAGPAFEGAGLSMGMAAAAGAVSRVGIDAGELLWETIGGAPPVGLCGTGVISLLSLLRETGALDETGLLVPRGALAANLTGEPPIFRLGNSGIALSQADVRAIQLAKAAIAAGLRTLLHAAGIAVEDVSVLYLCGGFGGKIDCRAAARIGLIPEELAQRAVAAGNAAGTGAAAMLMSAALRRQSEKLARDAQTLSLSESAYFLEQYLECMAF